MSVNYDFSKWTPRCSSLGYIMSDATGDSNAVKYDKLLDKKALRLTKLTSLGPNANTTRLKLLDEIDAIDKKIAIIEPLRSLPHLSETCKVHLADVYTAITTGRYEDVKSKYLEKGLLMEEDAITQYSLLTKKFFKKNKERKNNGWIEGELDFHDELMVYDTKVNWSIFQFNRTASRPLKHLYKWQGKGYCWLWGNKIARIIFSLLNTPEHLIKREQTRLMYELYGNEANMLQQDKKAEFDEACEEIRRNHTYDDIPLERKIRPYDVTLDEGDVEKIQARVIECREYLQKLDNYEIIDYGSEEEDISGEAA